VIGSLGVLSALLWQAIFKYPLQPNFESPARLWSDIATFFKILRQGIGLGGWLNTPLDPVLEALWLVGLVSLVAFSVIRVSSTLRRVLLIQSAFLLGVGVYLVSMLRVAGFGIQARFFMPLLAVMVVLIVTAPPVADGVQFSLPSRMKWRAFVIFVGLTHGSALLISAHRHANGLNGGPIDFSNAQWSPPGGWVLPGVIAVLGILVVATLPYPKPHESHVTPGLTTLS
jgi:hypothetical protein